MLQPRIIPCLLIQDKGLVKTINFKQSKYVGDPINAVRIFNEKKVDELTVFDISATVKNVEPDFKMIENLASECRMPFCYGGGIKTLDQAKKILSLGVEKIALSSVVLDTPEIITSLSQDVGSQSVVVVIDVKKKFFGGYDIYSHNGTIKRNFSLVDFVSKIQSLGAGEIILNSIDNDGLMQGYDLNLIRKLKNIIKVPLTALGGCGQINDIQHLIDEFGVIGVAVGSLFVFKGKYKAVLINYIDHVQKNNLLS